MFGKSTSVWTTHLLQLAGWYFLPDRELLGGSFTAREKYLIKLVSLFAKPLVKLGLIFGHRTGRSVGEIIRRHRFSYILRRFAHPFEDFPNESL